MRGKTYHPNHKIREDTNPENREQESQNIPCFPSRKHKSKKHTK